MKTLADFKRKLQPGVKISTLLYHMNPNGEYFLFIDYGERPVLKAQSNGCYLLTEGNDEDGNPIRREYWLEYPKAADFTAIDDSTAEIKFSFGKLIYKFI